MGHTSPNGGIRGLGWLLLWGLLSTLEMSPCKCSSGLLHPGGGRPASAASKGSKVPAGELFGGRVPTAVSTGGGIKS